MIYVNALNLVETTAPSVEPVTLQEAKDHCKVDTSDHDNEITAMIEGARKWCEAYTGRAFCERTYRADLRYWDSCVILPRPPLVSITSIKYYDTSNSLQTWASSNYEVDTAAGRVLLGYGKDIPSTYDRFDAWQCTFVAGYQSTTSPIDYRAPVPEGIKSAIKLVIGALFEERQNFGVGQGFTPYTNRAAEMLLDPYRARF